MSKIALITGGTSGLGESMAIALAKNNCIVYAAGRNINNKPERTNLHYIYMDVTKERTIREAVETIISTHRTINILINNAGIGIAAALEEMPVSEIQKAFDINLFGTLRMIQAVVPHMRKHGRGLVVNISSIAGQIGLPFQGVYSSTKYALEGMTEALSMELNPFNITVCMIEPGDYKTNVHLNRKLIRPAKSSPYYNRLKPFFEILHKNIQRGRNPEKLGKLIVKISKTKHPKLRYKSGRLFEVITPTLHWILPGRLFEKILSRFYKL